MNSSDHREQVGQEVLETREWLDSLDYVLENGGTERAGRLLQQLELHTARSGYRLPFSATTPYENTIPSVEAAPVSRRSGVGAPHQEPGALERAGHGDAGQQAAARHRWTYLHLRLGGHSVRGRLQSFLPGADAGRRSRPGFLPGTRVAGNLRARISGRAHSRKSSWRISAASWPKAAD